MKLKKEKSLEIYKKERQDREYLKELTKEELIERYIYRIDRMAIYMLFSSIIFLITGILIGIAH